MNHNRGQLWAKSVKPFLGCLGKYIMFMPSTLAPISSEGQEDDSELLLVATGATSTTDFVSDQFQFFGKSGEDGTYMYVNWDWFNPYLLQPFSLAQE